MEKKKGSFLGRFLARLFNFIADDFWMLMAVTWIVLPAELDIAPVAFCVVMAFYARLTEIRDNLTAPVVTMNFSNGQTITSEGEEA